MKEFKVENPKPGRKDLKLEGVRYGKLTVVKWSHYGQNNCKMWECICDCGNTTFVSTSNLRNGSTTSCKCNQYKKKEEHYYYNGFKDITGSRWNNTVWSARCRNLTFNITKEFVWELINKQNFKCKISGLPITFKDNSASIDRLDNSIGYEENNIQLVHKDINRMRNSYTLEYFIQICKLVANTH
jgi:hypothetical protein